MPVMTSRHSSRDANLGFTLAELAIVLVILAVLASVLVIPLSSQLEARQRAETAASLRDIREALIGFAILNKRLPCPTTGDGNESIDSVTNTCAASDDEAILPWRTLGVAPFDAWGNPWRYRTDHFFSDPAELEIELTDDPNDNIGVVDHTGTPLTSLGETATALVYSLGANQSADGQNATLESGMSSAIYEAGEPTTTYDDMVIWIGRPLLIARMAEAGSF